MLFSVLIAALAAVPAVCAMGGNIAGRVLVDAIMSGPLRGPITSFARASMIETAKKVGIDWLAYREAIQGANDWERSVRAVVAERPSLSTPEYYRQAFHAYDDGNLCLESAFEQEIAGKSVGARNFPAEGSSGESVLRSKLSASVEELGGSVLPRSRPQVIVDMGCGTGTSTRNLAKMYPLAESIVGIDLSPHFIAVGRWLLSESSRSIKWVDNSIINDARIELRYGNMEDTGLADGSAALVNLCLVIHELPLVATQRCLREAYRLLAPGGVLVLQEMDPSSPGYVKLRAGPLFYVLRSTEPYLDEYFDDVYPNIDDMLSATGFSVIRTAASTGRHFTKVALKAGTVDLRPTAEQRLASDAHLGTLRVPEGQPKR